VIGETLDTRKRLKVAYSTDFIIGILFLILGICVALFGIAFSDSISLSFSSYIYVSGMAPGGSSFAPNIGTSVWFWAPGWVISILGLASLFYGLQRALNGILKILILSNI